MDNRKTTAYSNTNGIIQGVSTIGSKDIDFDYVYNGDTKECDIYMPRVIVKLTGRLCGSDVEAFEKELESFVKSFFI